jgi:2-succinyl-5-enolpyruvyl-6-hydroxy-3-cyclohexene-1-carboxylate synthase
VALVCTSGTATANFHPAIIEAHYAQIPLLVLTTDRPHELRDSGANQTIDQIKMYGDHVRWFVDVAPPEAGPPPATLRYLRTLACRAIAASTGSVAGPVHLNFPFRKPLEPTSVPDDVPGYLDRSKALLAFKGRPDGRPFTRLTRGALIPSPDQVGMLAEAIQMAARGLIVCGPRCPADGFPQAVTQLAAASGYPILADALSGVRFGSHWQADDALILGGYESFLQPGVVANWESPELILHFGVTPTSKALGDYLGALPACQRVAINGSGTWHDDTHTLSDLLWADPTVTCRLLVERLQAVEMVPRDGHWVAALQHAERQAWQVFDSARTETFFEGVILADVVELMPPEALLYVASSLPVRHLDQFTQPRQANLRVLANRGASGIDGTISSALGAAAAVALPLVLVIGDLAFYHDLNGLLAGQRCGLKATIVLINNNGGGIFHRLPISNFDPPFTDLFVTPHGLKFEPVARMFGADYVRVTDRAAFRLAFQEATTAETTRVIEVTTDSVLHEKMRRRIVAEVAG